jgi:hypothetical protein
MKFNEADEVSFHLAWYKISRDNAICELAMKGGDTVWFAGLSVITSSLYL